MKAIDILKDRVEERLYFSLEEKRKATENMKFSVEAVYVDKINQYREFLRLIEEAVKEEKNE